MKKLLSFMVVGIFGVIPFVVNADSEIKFSCGNYDEEGNRTCDVGYDIDLNSPQNSVTVTLTEHGGAEILADSIVSADGSNFMMSTPSENGNVWTITLTSPDEEDGEHSLFSFTYKRSGEEDCKVTIAIGNDNKDVVDATPDESTDNVQTGSTLPYIALGTIALIAVGAYVVTRNKTKMYKI